jgi:hypothetical protein
MLKKMFVINKMSYWDNYREYITSLKENTNIDQALQNLQANDAVYEKLFAYEFSMLILQSPMVFMELLFTAVYMSTFGPKITQTIKDQFTSLTFSEQIRLCGENSPFLRDSRIADTPESNEDLKTVSENYYDRLVKKWNSYTPQKISETVSNLVTIANKLLGDGAGDKALVAAQAAVYGYGAAVFLREYGCANRAESGLSEEECSNAIEAKNNLVNAVQNLSL